MQWLHYSSIPYSKRRISLFGVTGLLNACYIGGASAYGGIGTVGGTLIGALIMGISINVQQVVKGLVLLAAVAFDVISKQKVSLPFIQRLFRRKRPAL